MRFAEISVINHQQVDEIFFNLADAVTKHNDIINPTDVCGIKVA